MAQENETLQKETNATEGSATQSDSAQKTDPQPVTDKKTDPQPVTDKKAEAKLRSEATKALNNANALFKRAKKQLSPALQKEVELAIKDLDDALKDQDHSCQNALSTLQSVTEKRLAFARKSGFQEFVESILIAFAVALVLRTFLIEPFKIPTRSMVPTLLEGDQLFVTKLSYGLRLPFINKYVAHFSAPERGDVVVFAFPREEAATYLAMTNSGCMQAESLSEDKDYIKRIIGIEGDTIEVINQTVHVNGTPIASTPIYERTVSDYMYLTDRRLESWNRTIHGNHTFTTITHELPANHFGPVKVAPGHVFVMGDNRDNSADSRCWGQVPIDNIKGRAQIIWWSGGHVGLRTERMFTKIN